MWGLFRILDDFKLVVVVSACMLGIINNHSIRNCKYKSSKPVQTQSDSIIREKEAEYFHNEIIDLEQQTCLLPLLQLCCVLHKSYEQKRESGW